jgi:predicted phage-related endonuclease
MLTPEQHAARAKGIGGSDASVIAGCSRFKSPYELAYEKWGQLPSPEINEDLRFFGHLLEEPLAVTYAKRTGLKVRRRATRHHPDLPWMLGNIDREILGDPRGPGILEITTTAVDEDDIESVLDAKRVQIQHYFGVYPKHRWGSIVYLLYRKGYLKGFRSEEVTRDDEFIEALIVLEQHFYEEVMVKRVPPSPDGTASCKDALRRLFPQDTGTVLTLDSPEVVESFHELLSVREAVKAADARKMALENTFKAHMGEASELRLPGTGTLTWKTASPSPKEIVDVETLKRDYPDIAQKVIRTELRSTGRRFLMHPAKGLIAQKDPHVEHRDESGPGQPGNGGHLPSV